MNEMIKQRQKKLTDLEQKISSLDNEIDNENYHQDFIHEGNVLTIIKILEDAGIDCFEMFGKFMKINK